MVVVGKVVLSALGLVLGLASSADSPEDSQPGASPREAEIPGESPCSPEAGLLAESPCSREDQPLGESPGSPEEASPVSQEAASPGSPEGASLLVDPEAEASRQEFEEVE